MNAHWKASKRDNKLTTTTAAAATVSLCVYLSVYLLLHEQRDCCEVAPAFDSVAAAAVSVTAAVVVAHSHTWLTYIYY